MPDVLNTAVYDEVIAVRRDAFAAARELARTEGLLTGISRGGAVGGDRAAQREDSEGKTIVAVLPDTGERYLSTSLFAEDR